VISPMTRVRIVGPRRLLPEVLRLLQREGTVHLRPLPLPMEGWTTVGLERSEADRTLERRLEVAVERTDQLLRALRRPALASAPAGSLPDPAAEDFAARLDAVAVELRALDERSAALDEEKALLARYQRLLVALAPLFRELDGTEQVDTMGILVKAGETHAVALLEEAVARATSGAYTLVLRQLDAEQLAGLLAVPRRFGPAVSQLLFERGVSEVKLPERYRHGSFAASVKQLLERSRELAGEVAVVDRELDAFASRWRAPLLVASREARDRLARLRAVSFCAETHHSFTVVGWSPARRIAGLRRALDVAWGGAVVLFCERVRREEWDDVPVVLENPRWLRPFELLLSLQPLPRYGSIDPTPFLALFFPLFFGLILGDVGHGILGLAISLWARHRRWGGATGRKVATIALACSISAIVFGILFGELLGELGGVVGLHPILMDRRHALVPLLAMVVALGGIHIALGVGLGALAAARQREVKTALSRLATLLLLIDVAVGVLAWREVLPAGLTTACLWAAAPLVAAAIGLEGPLGALELVRTAGAILSYARLMAVGLASVMFAAVANRLAEVVHPAPVGVGLAIVLHTVNFTLGLVSPTIQALRLQVVEFFDKFYVPGGRAYRPLSLAT
jgi:V/A-type H+/Na+-transporting ATPase subunit I